MSQIPEQLKKEEFRFILANTKSKVPIEEKWTTDNNYKYDDKKLMYRLNTNDSYGFCGGFGHSLVIDSDNEEFSDWIEQNCPKTFTVQSGSHLPGKFHFYYETESILNKYVLEIANEDKKVTRYGEMQGYGAMVIGPSCKHESGNTYDIVKDIPISKISNELLEKIKEKFCNVKEANIEDEKKFKVRDFEKGNIEEQLNVTHIFSINGLKQHKDEYYGAHPIHGSETGMNFWINPSKNIWSCFRHKVGKSCSGGGVAMAIAIKEGLIDCSEAHGKLNKDIYIKVLNIAEKKYGFVKKDFSNEIINEEEIELPKKGRLITKFITEIGNILNNKNTLFYRTGSRDIVEIGEIKNEEDNEQKYTGFMIIKPHRFVTLCEKYFTPIIREWNEYYNEWGTREKSMTAELSNICLQSNVLQSSLPQISRIFTVPIPIIYKNKITFPKRGYDKRFNSWLPYNSPTISNTNMELEEAKKIITDIYCEFCFQTKQDFTHAVAALLTPFLKGLFSNFNKRIPLWVYLANREGVGKDFCAKITALVYEGYFIEESAISTGERSNNNEELRKKILGALMNGRQRIHFSNNKGNINNAVLEGLITSEYFNDRVLGRNELLEFSNELEISLSGNIGISFTPDLIRRSRFIKQLYPLENINERKFKNPKLDEWVEKNRELILSALYALVKNWIDKGMPAGKEPFTSFPEWSKICGGIMECAGYDSPCQLDKDAISVVDKQTEEMKELFFICYESFPEKTIKKKEIIQLLSENDLFGYYDFTNRSDQIKFGNRLMLMNERIFSDIRLQINKGSKSTDTTYIFTKLKAEKQETIFK